MLQKFKDMGKILKQAQEMKSAMQEVQEELKKTVIPVEALNGKINEKLKNEILMKFMGNVSIVYKESEEEFFVVICKNQTCSEKLKDLIQINEYIKNNL